MLSAFSFSLTSSCCRSPAWHRISCRGRRTSPPRSHETSAIPSIFMTATENPVSRNMQRSDSSAACRGEFHVIGRKARRRCSTPNAKYAFEGSVGKGARGTGNMAHLISWNRSVDVLFASASLRQDLFLSPLSLYEVAIYGRQDVWLADAVGV